MNTYDPELIDTIGKAIGKKYLDTYDQVNMELLDFNYCFDVERSSLLDLCCGNGFFGQFYAMMNPEKKVTSVDIAMTNQYKKVESILGRPNHKFLQRDITKQELPITEDTLVTAIHACGELTDIVIEQAVSNQVPFAVMPCCYGKRLYFPADGAQHEDMRSAIDASRYWFIKNNGYAVRIRKLSIDSPINTLIMARPEYQENI